MYSLQPSPQHRLPARVAHRLGLGSVSSREYIPKLRPPVSLLTLGVTLLERSAVQEGRSLKDFLACGVHCEGQMSLPDHIQRSYVA